LHIFLLGAFNYQSDTAVFPLRELLLIT